MSYIRLSGRLSELLHTVRVYCVRREYIINKPPRFSSLSLPLSQRYLYAVPRRLRETVDLIARACVKILRRREFLSHTKQRRGGGGGYEVRVWFGGQARFPNGHGRVLVRGISY